MSRRTGSLTLGTILRIGILDSGLAPSSVPIEACRSFIGEDGSLDDETGHATACLRALDASLAFYGVAVQQIRLVLARTLGSRPEATDVEDISRALRWLVEMRVNVIAIPLSVSVDADPLRLATSLAVSRGILVVAAAGIRECRVAFPAAYEGVIAVQANPGRQGDRYVETESVRDDSRAVMCHVARSLPRLLAHVRVRDSTRL